MLKPLRSIVPDTAIPAAGDSWGSAASRPIIANPAEHAPCNRAFTLVLSRKPGSLIPALTRRMEQLGIIETILKILSQEPFRDQYILGLREGHGRARRRWPAKVR